MKIATVNIHTGVKQYMVGMDGIPTVWKDYNEANEQIRLLNQTCGFSKPTPKNFVYVIEND